MMVVSLDPVGQDRLARVDRRATWSTSRSATATTTDPKLNSLMSYADRHPKHSRKGGMRTLQDAVGALLGIPIHYYARMDFGGFITMVDAVGGVDVDVAEGLRRPRLRRLRRRQAGLLDHGRQAPSRRRERPCLCPHPQVRR